jgi:hypothetical protein
MPVLPMRQAAQAAGVSRQTLYRYVSTGKVSVTALADGSKGVDTSELLRVFGQLAETGETETETVTSYTKRQAQDTEPQAKIETELYVTRAELAATKAAVDILRDQLEEAKAEKRTLFDIVQSQTRLLEDKRPQAASSGGGSLAVVSLILGVLAVVLVAWMLMQGQQ